MRRKTEGRDSVKTTDTSSILDPLNGSSWRSVLESLNPSTPFAIGCSGSQTFERTDYFLFDGVEPRSGRFRVKKPRGARDGEPL
jgi:hypothetical protein